MGRYKSKRIVVKVGTKVIASRDKGLDRDRIRSIAEQIADIMDRGVSVLIVTSGAIGAGMWLLGMKKRPVRLAELQAAAAVGQNHLMRLYSEFFKARGYNAGQILFTQEDFDDRKRFLNIKHPIDSLVSHNAIPVINENDTVATDEIRCGDNDRLSALVADLCGADKLILLTDVEGLLDKDGNVVRTVSELTPEIATLAGRSRCDMGTGGMATKLEAARHASGAGIECVIADGRKKGVILKIMEGELEGTVFCVRRAKFLAKKRWIAFSSKPKGALGVDKGALKALMERGKSLLASGIFSVEGAFASGDVVRITDEEGREFARGVSSYSYADLSKIIGLKSADFRSVLGHEGPDEVIHRDNLVIL